MKKARLSSATVLRFQTAFESVFRQHDRAMALQLALPQVLALVGEIHEPLPQKIEASLMVRRAFDNATIKYHRAVAANQHLPTAASPAVPAMEVNRYSQVINSPSDVLQVVHTPKGTRKTSIVLSQLERIDLTRRFTALMALDPTRDKWWAVYQAQDVLPLHRRREQDRRHSILKCVYTQADPWEFSLVHRPESITPDTSVVQSVTPPPVVYAPAPVETRYVHVVEPTPAPVAKCAAPLASAAQAGAVLNILSGRGSREYPNHLFDRLARMEAELQLVHPMMDLIERMNLRMARMRRENKAMAETINVLIERKMVPEPNSRVVSVKGR